MPHIVDHMRSSRFWMIAAAVWLVFGLMCGIQVWISMIGHGHSVPLLLAYHVIVWGAWWGITAVIERLARRYPVLPPRPRYFAVHALAASIIAVLHIAFWLLMLVVLQPFDAMTGATENLRIGKILISRFPLELIIYAAVLGAIQTLDYYRQYRVAQTSLDRARLHVLELQLQPHFLFNTLNSVSALVRVGKQHEAIRMIALLSDLLRYTLDRAGAQRITLDEEVATVHRYFELQRIRFADRIALEISIADDVRRAMVPTFILQPLAENAVRHGVARSAGTGRVELRAFRQEGYLTIEMFNTGALDRTPVPGIGLRNTAARLQQLYGEDHRFALTASAGGGVIASVTIPWSSAG